MSGFDPGGNSSWTVNFTAPHTLPLKKLQAFNQVCGIQKFQVSGVESERAGLEMESDPQITLGKFFTKKNMPPKQRGSRFLMAEGQ